MVRTCRCLARSAFSASLPSACWENCPFFNLRREEGLVVLNKGVVGFLGCGSDVGRGVLGVVKLYKEGEVQYASPDTWKETSCIVTLNLVTEGSFDPSNSRPLKCKH